MFFDQFINTIQNEWKHHHDFHPHDIPTDKTSDIPSLSVQKFPLQTASPELPQSLPDGMLLPYPSTLSPHCRTYFLKPYNCAYETYHPGQAQTSG